MNMGHTHSRVFPKGCDTEGYIASDTKDRLNFSQPAEGLLQ